MLPAGADDVRGALGSVCVWNSRASQCQRRCSWKYFTSATCTADNSCQWLASSGACAEKCSLQSAGTCELLSHCIYADAACACTTKCQRYYNSTGTTADTFVSDCGNDADCIVGTWAGSSNCYMKCSVFDRFGCSRNDHCMWNDITGRCVLGCDNRYRRLLYGVTASYASYNTSCAADADGECVVGRRNAGWACDPKCSLFLTVDSCRQPGNCVWSEAAGACLQKCSTRYDTVNTNACASDTDCRAGCQDRCDYQLTMWGCENVTNCRWFNNSCVAGCSGLPKLSCIAAARCDWDATTLSCVDECSTLPTEARCRSVGVDCAWSNWTMMCTKATCSNYQTQDACMADPTSCDWLVGGGCVQACSKYNTTAGCSNSRNCVWVGTEARCAVKQGARRSRFVDRLSLTPTIQIFGSIIIYKFLSKMPRFPR